MRFAVFVFLVAFLIVLAVPVSALDGWNYCRTITITNDVATIKVVTFSDIVKIPTPPKPEGRTLKEVYESITLKTFGLPLEVISLIALLSIAVVGYGFGAFKGTVNLFFLSVLYYIAANALGWSTYVATGLLVVSAILLVIVVAFLKED